MLGKRRHREGFGCTADPEEATAELLTDPYCVRLKITEPWLSDMDRKAPGLFAIARQIVS